MAKQQSITSLPRSPEDDRRARMIKYSVTMGIRLICIFVCFLVPGYWIIIPAIGAVVLPYIAVVAANMTNSRPATVQRPDQLALPLIAPAAADPDAEDQKFGGGSGQGGRP